MRSLIILLFLSIYIFVPQCVFADIVTVFAPSRAEIEIMPATEKAAKKIPDNSPEEVDILFTLRDTESNQIYDMEMPQMFAELYFPKSDSTKEPTFERRDLLGDVEEIRYNNKKAWGANVAIEHPGLYQFIMDARPRWDSEKQNYTLTHAKIILPALGVGKGWEIPTGQALEILPLTRPFGLTAPALFSGRIIYQGKPCANVEVTMSAITPDKLVLPTHWHKNLVARSDSMGQFSFVLNHAGWWYCEANITADPLKGPDGELKPVIRTAILWLYVDAPAIEKGNNKK